MLDTGEVVNVNRNDIHKPTIDPSAVYERSILYISEECLQGCRAQDYDPFLIFTQASERKTYVLRLEDFRGTEAGGYLSRLEAAEKVKKPETAAEERIGRKLEETLLFQLFLLSLNRICLEDGREARLRPSAMYNQKIIDLLSYLNGHLYENISIDRLAETFYISKYHMMRQFKNETGYTIHRYLTEKRIAAAKEKLLCGIPAVRVGEECGFADYSTFLRAFRSCTHMTPTAFAEERKARSLDAARNPL